MPIVLGGVRVATVASVGMATIAAAIGAEGLGSYIFRGVSLSDTRLILLGSVPAALLALACDAALGELEHALDPTRPRHSRIRRPRRRRWPSPPSLGLRRLGLVARAPAADADRPTIMIGSKDGSEMILLGHMLADLVEAHTDRSRSIAGSTWAGRSSATTPCSREGSTPTSSTPAPALTTILKEPVQTTIPQRVLERVRPSSHDRDERRLPRPVRLREHVRPPDAARAGRASWASGRSPTSGPPARRSAPASAPSS